MIVRNEEEVLEQCLESVDEVCDEIIIVDTGSTDRTKEIAQKFTNKIMDFQWIDDFSAARNYSFSLATKEYILWLDADDILLQRDLEKLKTLKRCLDPSVDSVSMKYILSFDEYYNPSFYLRRNRLVKRTNNFKWRGPVHEYLEVRGRIVNADIAVIHRKEEKKSTHSPSNRNLQIYEKLLASGEEFSPRNLFYYANELKDHKRMKDAITYYNKFLDTGRGWVEDRIRACLYLADIYRILNKEEMEMEVLLKTFHFEYPRPESSCRLGDLFQKEGNFRMAVYWYYTAISNKPESPQGFHHEAFSTWYPHLSLCKCHWKLGEVDKAIEHNDIVAITRPNDPRVLYNQEFFRKNENINV